MMRISRPAWMANDLSTPGKALATVFEGLEALEVVLQRLAASAGAAAADGVGDDRDDRLDGARLDFLVVRLDAVDDGGVDAVTLRQLRAEVRVRALDLVVDRLADVVEEAAAARDLDVGAELVGDHGGEVGGLDGVPELVLAVAVAVLEAAERCGRSRGGGRGSSASTIASSPASLIGRVDFLAGLLDHLLDAGRVDAAVREAASSARCARSSRRTGSKPERVTASGVSSMMTSTPVACSMARMLRPSRPMMRPFMSSEGSGTTETVVSETTSLVRRCIVGGDDLAGALVGLFLDLLLDLAQAAVGIVADLVSQPARGACSRASPTVRLERRSSSTLRASSTSVSLLRCSSRSLLSIAEGCSARCSATRACDREFSSF